MDDLSRKKKKGRDQTTTVERRTERRIDRKVPRPRSILCETSGLKRKNEKSSRSPHKTQPPPTQNPQSLWGLGKRDRSRRVEKGLQLSTAYKKGRGPKLLQNNEGNLVRRKNEIENSEAKTRKNNGSEGKDQNLERAVQKQKRWPHRIEMEPEKLK